MRVRLLGPVEVDGADGSPVELPAAKERSLVAALALCPGAEVATGSLIAALWGDEPPAAARKTLQTYVWNLRQALGSESIATAPAGYRLAIAAGDVDVQEFRRLTRAGDLAMREGRVAEARALLIGAEALWRGPALAGVASHTGLASEATRLEEERLSALEARIAADLAVGHVGHLVGELEALVAEHPLRERLWADLMLALYRSGRQADALRAYQRARAVLLDELGLEPGGELRRLEAAILSHDPSADGDDIPAALSATEPVRRSPVRYATTADGVAIAYQEAGAGPCAILAVPGFVHHLDIWWNAPTDALVRRLTSMGRLIVFDTRGMGLSDRPDVIDLDGWALDALAVLDAVGLERAVVLGIDDGALTAVRLASQHPDRVEALVLHHPTARHVVADDYAAGVDADVVESWVQNLERRWGTGVAISTAAPSLAADPAVRSYWARYQRLSASPTAAIRALRTALAADIRHLLAGVRAPTLVVHAERNRLVPLAQGLYVADGIAGAELVVLDSDVHLICVSDVLDQIADHIEDFLDRRVRSAGARGPDQARWSPATPPP